MRKMQAKQELVKENFTFRRRGVKAGLMVKINEFVENLTDEVWVASRRPAGLRPGAPRMIYVGMRIGF